MLYLLLIPLLAAVTLHMAITSNQNQLLLAAIGSGDEDIKIAPGSFSAAGAEERISEAEADALAYMRQKEAGNVDRARELGVQFAKLLEAQAAQLPDSESPDQTLRTHHQLLLYSYAVNRVIGDLSPNSILAQIVLNVFYDELEGFGLHSHVRDMAAFSLYILCERSEICPEDEIGKIYARLCGKEGQKTMVDEGNRLYQEFHLNCTRLHEGTQYVAV